MKVSRILAVLAVSGIILGGASQALAWGHRGGGSGAAMGGHRGAYAGNYVGDYAGCPVWDGARPASMPSLTTDQQSELQTMIKDFHSSIEPKRQELMAKQLELDAFAGNPSAKLDDISKLSKDIARLNSELNQAGVAFQDKVAEKFGQFGFNQGQGPAFGRNFSHHRQGRHHGGYRGY